jgi:hypothetical protein
VFQSYAYINYLDYDQKKHRYEYKIVDDDWVGVGWVGPGIVNGVGVAVIQEYSKRDLLVAPNLVRAFQWYSKNYGYSIEQIIAWNKEYNPKFKQYEEDIEKYLVLL